MQVRVSLLLRRDHVHVLDHHQLPFDREARGILRHGRCRQRDELVRRHHGAARWHDEAVGEVLHRGTLRAALARALEDLQPRRAVILDGRVDRHDERRARRPARRRRGDRDRHRPRGRRREEAGERECERADHDSDHEDPLHGARRATVRIPMSCPQPRVSPVRPPAVAPPWPPEAQATGRTSSGSPSAQDR